MNAGTITIVTIIIILMLALSNCSPARMQPINLTMKTIVASPRQVQTIHCNPESVTGFYSVATNTIVIPMPRNWKDTRAMETAGHELFHAIGYLHDDDWFLDGKGDFK